MCTELLPPGGYPFAVGYIISYHPATKVNDIKRKCYLQQQSKELYYPSIHHYHRHTTTTTTTTTAAAAPTTTITIIGRVCSTHVIRNAYILIRTAVCVSSYGRKKAQPKPEDNISRVIWLRIRTSDEFC